MSVGVNAGGGIFEATALIPPLPSLLHSVKVPFNSVGNSPSPPRGGGGGQGQACVICSPVRLNGLRFTSATGVGLTLHQKILTYTGPIVVRASMTQRLRRGRFFQSA
eukprot:jgi/Botrbrau1/13883/Bobra.0056s0114.1